MKRGKTGPLTPEALAAYRVKVAASRAANKAPNLPRRARTVPSDAPRETLEQIASSLGLAVVNGRVGR
jgi:hypothetical protein